MASSPLRSIAFRVAVPVLILVVAVVLACQGDGWMRVGEWTSRMGRAGPILFVPFGALMMSLLIPKTAVSITAGLLFGSVTGSLVLTSTAILAAFTNYYLGRWWLHAWIRRRTENAWSLVRELAKEAGFLTHLMFRLAPIPTSFISYSMGASGAHLRPYMMAAVVGSIPQWMWVTSGAATGMVLSGSVRSQTNETAGWISLGVSVGAAIALTVFLPKMAAERLRQLRSQQDDESRLKGT